MKAVNFVTEWWPMIMVVLCAILLAVRTWIIFSKKSDAEKQAALDEQIDNVKKWLLYAVTLAESDLGSGTGMLKLRKTYDMFLSKFPMLIAVVSFETFSNLVDEVLDEMKNMLDKNTKINTMVENKEVS